MSMGMTFHLATNTPLLLPSWQPSNVGEYAASCLFLIALAALTRILIAIRPILDVSSWRREYKYHRQLQHEPAEKEHEGHNHVEGDTEAAQKGNHLPPPEKRRSGWAAITLAVRDHWENAALSSRVSRAGFDMLIAGLGYLVMLAVMTMNVGYFLSVLGGVFLGTFLLAVPMGADAHNSSQEDCG
ncbi:low-affinity copper transporter encoded by the ctr2 protein [Podospora aff. communis PSN243]|uniref:Copper transport protein n=1 Tax=Podospora aff. communis PSN243 TaxID=3040156 RepID=A0AAV9GF13_9PEZI|nr:low-affinity copper transporter encoded by the ctr2 protein [Podospora aff. communis PSN243]